MFVEELIVIERTLICSNYFEIKLRNFQTTIENNYTLQNSRSCSVEPSTYHLQKSLIMGVSWNSDFVKAIKIKLGMGYHNTNLKKSVSEE